MNAFMSIFLAAWGLYALRMIVVAIIYVIPSSVGNLPDIRRTASTAESLAWYSMPGRTTLLEAHAKIHHMLGKVESGGFEIIKANNNSYLRARTAYWTKDEINQYAIKLSRLENYIEENELNTNIIYISTQPQIINNYTVAEADYPLPDDNALMESMLYNLKRYNIDFLDVSLTLKNSLLTPSQYIYRTDTKWTNQASFTVMQALIGKLNDQYGDQITIAGYMFGTDNYRFETHETVFLGDIGMAAGEPFTGKEDFLSITPLFDTSYSYDAQGNQSISISGAFHETLFNENAIYPENLYHRNSYASYLNGGDYYFRKITNHNNPDGPKALFIHDATALPLAALISPAFSEVYMYWPQLDSSGEIFDLENYLKENNFDFLFFQGEANIYSLDALFGFSLNDA